MYVVTQTRPLGRELRKLHSWREGDGTRTSYNTAKAHLAKWQNNTDETENKKTESKKELMDLLET